MQSVSELHELLGELVKRNRATSMDQNDFAKRVGCSPRTLSRLEQGIPVSSETLFTALALTGQLDGFIELANTKLRIAARLPERKRGHGSQVIDNDF